MFGLYGSALAALLSTSLPIASACTSLVLNTTSGNYFYGRTMEFGFEINSRPVVIPRQYAYVGTAAGDQSGLSWSSQYAVAGMNAFGQPVVADGVNEKGLVCGILYLPGFAQYTPSAQATASRSMGSWEFCTWALGNYATVAQVVNVVPGIFVTDVPVPGSNFTPPFHYTLHDRCGNSVVIEPNTGTLVVTKNPLTVMTNSPHIDFHLLNMNNYMHLSPFNADPIVLKNGETISGFGQGTGWQGLPGDMTSPSRFIRAAASSLTALDNLTDANQNIRLVEHMMNDFDIPYGVVRSSEPWDYTQWTSIVDISSANYYFKMYNNSVLQGLDFSDYNLASTSVYTATIPDEYAPKMLILQ